MTSTVHTAGLQGFHTAGPTAAGPTAAGLQTATLRLLKWGVPLDVQNNNK